jgi:hypothetical protein
MTNIAPYPRPGEPLIPQRLRRLLEQQGWFEAVDHAQLSGDAACWEQYDEVTCRRLGAEVVQAISAVWLPLLLLHERVSQRPVALDTLAVSRRTYNALA